MKKATGVLWAVTVLMFLILCGCGGGSDDSNGSGSVKVANNSFSGLAVAMVQIAPASADTWGPNQLNANQIIASGSTLTFTGIEPGIYSMLVTLEDGQQLQWDGLVVSDGQTTNTIVSSAYKAVNKTTVNPESSPINVNFTYVHPSGIEGAAKETPDTAIKVSDQYVTEVVK